MASVFLSYDREDAGKARPIAAALEKAGHSVWWDRHIKGGAQYSKEIDKALKAADAVVVLWSERSVESAWVRDEAAAGRDSGRLIPIGLDSTEPPLGFRQYQAIDISRWNGRGRPPQLGQLDEAIEALGGELPAGPAARRIPAAAAASDALPSLRRYWWLIAGLLIVLLGLAISRPWEAKASIPLVSVAAADRSAGANALARDVLVQLGNYQASSPDEVQLTDQDADRKPDLIIEVSGTPSGPRPSANLVLLRGKDRMLLASQEFSSENGAGNDLAQSLAMSAARLLRCAAGTLRARRALPHDDLKLYLGACGRFGGLYGSDDISLILPQLQQVAERHPGFVPAWKLLLLGGASLAAFPSDQPKPSRDWLRTQIERARKADSEMPEIEIAELALLPATSFAERLRRVESINADVPENPAILDIHAEQLLAVGRLNEALGLAERAALLDPISPAARATFIRALAYSGRIPAAMQEMVEAAPLALGSKNLIEARFRLNMRYGDAQEALSLLRRYGTSKSHEAFLLARLDPTPSNVAQAISVNRSMSSELGLFGSYSEVLSAFGRHDDLYRALMTLRPNQVDPSLLNTLFRPTLKPLRQDSRFLHIAQRFGLLDYWRKSGNWPDFCSEPDLPYDCKQEAAKLAT
ncbi:MAG TPA: TIR domain-containing protein [Sphingomicrobium sp.]|nr:TIR domain-containing protein [Sphingomicrobium sp.]